MPNDPRAGQPADPADLVDIAALLRAYDEIAPDPSDPTQRVAFGTSGHRGSAFRGAFNEAHILATTEAICRYRELRGYDGPLFIGRDTHALSEPATRTALEVLVARGVDVRVDSRDGFTPTPAVSHAIIVANRGRDGARLGRRRRRPVAASPTGSSSRRRTTRPTTAASSTTRRTAARPTPTSPAGSRTRRTGCSRRRQRRRWPASAASRSTRRRACRRGPRLPRRRTSTICRRSSTWRRWPRSGLRIGVDPMGGASVAYWGAIAERYGLDLTVVNDRVDPTFGFMTYDWDGKIRMDPSSPSAMAGLIALRDRFDIALGNDADADRHGVVTPAAGLLNPNHFLSAAIAYLFGGGRPGWGADVGVGKTLVSSSMIDRVVADLGRRLVEVPVGFKWFVAGLVDGSLGFGGEESAGASFLRRDGTRLDDRQGRDHRRPARLRADGADRPRPGRRLRAS